MSMLEYVQQTFLELVQIDSHSLQEGEIAGRLLRELESFGFQVVVDGAGEALGGQTGNLIATLAGSIEKPKLLLAAHMDTVRPGVSVKPRLDESGTVWSDGTTVLGADDKAGITAILTAVREIVQSNIAHGQIQVLFSIAEEIGLQGAHQLQANVLQANMGLSLDSGGQLGTVVVAGPAQVKWKAKVTGKSSHAGVAPELGISAIQVAAKAVARMPHGRIDGVTTVNIGSFVGEGPTNVVRDNVELLGEARSQSPEKLTQVLHDIEKSFVETAEEHGAKAEFEVNQSYDGFNFTVEDLVYLRVAQALRIAGFEPRSVSSGGGSDANVISALGIPTINIGIGYEDIHSTNEHIKLADIENAAKVIVHFCTI